MEELAKNGAGFKSITELIDTTTPEGHLMFHQFGSFAQYERELIAQRTAFGLEKWLKLGLWPSGVAPFGYTLKDGKLQIAEKEAKIVRLGGAPVSPLHRSPRLGAGLTWRLPWPADFQLILMRVRIGLGLAAGGGAASPGVFAFNSLKTPRLVRYAAINTKKARRCGMPSLLRIGFENQQKNFA